ncbi:MAG: sulfatase-like hydrolase/transferase [Planctomycetota bacterium]|nr:sulfatase-like hydrolase/transferase [Planctomycetota bacterium]
MTKTPILLIALCLLTTMNSLALADNRPNVLFLFADDQRPDTVAALGNPVIKTPNLDQLAQRGFAFNNAYCMGSTMGAVCNPSRHMTLSGMSLYRYQGQKKEGTWGDVFRKAGYVTYHQSKRGNTARTYHTAFEFSSYLNDGAERNSGHHGRTAANTAIEFLDKTWNREKPLFMYVGFAGPHDPRVAAKQWMDLYDRDKIPLPPNYKPFHPIDNGWMTGRDEKLAPWPRTEDVVRRQLHDYYACISSIDHHIGRIIAQLKQLGELDNTIVIFSADHGLAMGSHGLFGKQNLYEHSMRSPMIFAGPKIHHGRSNALMYLFDIFPTACDLAGLKPPESLEGRSVGDVIRGTTHTHRDAIFCAYEKGQRSLRVGDWKLYRFPLVNHSMLFNLAEDPNELTNLADVAEHRTRADRMLVELARQQKLWSDPHPHTSATPTKPEITDVSFFTNPKNQPKKKPRKKQKRQ